MKIAISWFGFNEDFITKGQMFQYNPAGFTGTIHSDIIKPYAIDKHVILCSTDSSGTISDELSKKKKSLSGNIKESFPNHQVELRDIGIDKNDLQNFPVIEALLRSFLTSFDATDDLHVIAGTGPTAVGMAWSTLSLSMEQTFRLYVLKRREYTPGGKLTILNEIKPFVSKFLDNKLKESHFNIDLPAGIYEDEIVKNEYKRAKDIAAAVDINVLLLGETGCGKDKMAEFIISNSPLDQAKYRAINCASLSDELLYSELFGHVKGAFTGADKDRKGLFEECNGGTLFLDEIGDISPFMQQSLLRAIENGEIKRAGDNEVKKGVRVRIIAATNNELYQNCRAGKFRWDLYYRLCTMEIELEPYRNRTALQRKKAIEHYVRLAEHKWGRKITFGKDAVEIMRTYSFPGNFREIYNTMNGIYALGKQNITNKDLPRRFVELEAIIDEKYDSALRKHCCNIYKKYDNNLALTCKALGYQNVSQLKKKFISWGFLS